MTAKIASAFVSLIGLLVLIAWKLDIPFFENIYNGAPSMKPYTALAFILSGLVAFFVRHPRMSFISSSMSVFLIFFSVIMGTEEGAETILANKNGLKFFEIHPGVPSMMSLVCFVMVGMSGLAALVNGGRVARIFGHAIFGAGAICCLGHILQIPELFYYIRGLSAGMAVHEGVLFIILGWALAQTRGYPKHLC